MKPLKIDEEFKNLLPPLTDDERSELENDIKRHGVLSPIITWNGFIIDGHNRYEICQRNGIEIPATKELEFANKSDVMDWIIKHQTGRRNLTKSQLVKAYSVIEEQLRKEAKIRKEANLKQNSDGVKFDPSEKGRTAETVAKKIGVSKNTYKAMKQIVNEGSAEQIERMDKGGKGNGVSAIVAEIKEKKLNQDVPDGYKRCSKCGKVKPFAEFSKDKYKKSGLKSVCKECDVKRQRKYNALNGTDSFGNRVELSEEAKRMTEEDVRRGLYDNEESKVQTFDDEVTVFKANILYQFNNSFRIFSEENNESLSKKENATMLKIALNELREAIDVAERSLK